MKDYYLYKVDNSVLSSGLIKDYISIQVSCFKLKNIIAFNNSIKFSFKKLKTSFIPVSMLPKESREVVKRKRVKTVYSESAFLFKGKVSQRTLLKNLLFTDSKNKLPDELYKIDDFLYSQVNNETIRINMIIKKLVYNKEESGEGCFDIFYKTYKESVITLGDVLLETEYLYKSILDDFINSVLNPILFEQAVDQLKFNLFE